MRRDLESAVPIIDKFYLLDPHHQATSEQRDLHLQEVRDAGGSNSQIS